MDQLAFTFWTICLCCHITLLKKEKKITIFIFIKKKKSLLLVNKKINLETPRSKLIMYAKVNRVGLFYGRWEMTRDGVFGDCVSGFWVAWFDNSRVMNFWKRCSHWWYANVTSDDKLVGIKKWEGWCVSCGGLELPFICAYFCRELSFLHLLVCVSYRICFGR